MEQSQLLSQKISDSLGIPELYSFVSVTQVTKKQSSFIELCSS
jgi:hypothetical protein